MSYLKNTKKKNLFQRKYEALIFDETPDFDFEECFKVGENRKPDKNEGSGFEIIYYLIEKISVFFVLDINMTNQIFAAENCSKIAKLKYQNTFRKKLIESDKNPEKKEKRKLSKHVMDLLKDKHMMSEDQGKPEERERLYEKVKDFTFIKVLQEIFKKIREEHAYFLREEVYKELQVEEKDKDKDLTDLEEYYSTRIDKSYGIEDFISGLFFFDRNKNDPVKNILKEEEKNSYPFIYDFSGNSIDFKNFLPVLLPVFFDEKISALNISDNTIKNFGLFIVGNILVANKRLKEIKIAQNKIKSYQMYDFLAGLKSSHYFYGENTNITYLNLSSNELDSKCALVLSKILNEIPELRNLNLSKNNLGSGVGILAHFLRNKYRGGYKLEILELASNNITREAIKELGKLIQEKSCKLKSLNISYSSLDNPEGKEFLICLSHNKSLKDVFLYGCKINNYHLEELKAVTKMSNFKRIKLFKNQLDYIGIVEMIENSKEFIHESNETNKLNEMGNSINPCQKSLSNIPTANTSQSIFASNLNTSQNVLQDTSSFALLGNSTLASICPPQNNQNPSEEPKEQQKNEIDLSENVPFKLNKNLLETFLKVIKSSKKKLDFIGVIKDRPSNISLNKNFINVNSEEDKKALDNFRENWDNFYKNSQKIKVLDIVA